MAAPEERGREEPRGVEFWLAPFFRDSTLWPVVAVAAAISVVLGASGLLLAFVERNPFAILAVAILFWISVDATLRSRRRGGSRLLPACLAGFWLLSAGAAIAARAAGWF